MIIDTKWKAMIKLTTENGGIFCLDVNRHVDILWEDGVTTLTTGYSSVRVKETPEDICKLVDAKIEAQVAAKIAEAEADAAARENYYSGMEQNA